MAFPLQLQLKEVITQQPISALELTANGKFLLLFYHTHCLGCTGRAIPLAYKLQQNYPAVNVLLIHVNLSTFKPTSKDILEVFVEGKSPLPIYIDEHADWYNYYGCEGTPHWIILDENRAVYNSIFDSQENAQNRLMYTLESLLQ